MMHGEIRLASGLALAAAGAALSQFVIIGLAGLALLVPAFVLLLGAGFAAGTGQGVPAWRWFTGFIFHTAGVLLLIALALDSAALAHAEILHTLRGSAPAARLDWTRLLAASCAPAAAVSAGHLLQTDAFRWRVLFWGFAAGCVLPAAVLLVRLLARNLPVTA